MKPRARERGSRRAELWPWLLVALAALVPYLNALPGGFTYDDGGVILRNPAVDPASPWWRSLAAPYWPDQQQAGLYRPMTLLTYRLQRGMGGQQALPFHLLNLLLHAGVSLLGLALLRRLALAPRGVSLAAALLFAVHPLHTEAVTNIVGRAELLAALAGLIGYRLWLDPRPGVGRAAAAALAFALAAASKESAVAWLLLLAAHRAGLFGDGRGYRALASAGRSAPGSVAGALGAALRADACVLAGIGAYLVARIAVLGSLLPALPVSLADNPLQTISLAERIPAAFAIVARGVGLVLWPLRLRADYSFDAIPLAGIALPGFLALAAGLALALAAWRARRAAPLPLWGLAFHGLLLLPVSNLIAPIGTIFAERLLYLPSLGMLAAVAGAVAAAGRAVAAARGGRARGGRAALVLFAIVLALLGWRTWTRNPDWKDDATLFSVTVSDQPRSVKARANLGALGTQAGAWQNAEREYREALRILPDYLPALNGLGHALLMQGRHDEAEAIFERALAQHPGSLETRVRLGNLLLERGRPAEALARFDEVIARAPTSGEAWIGRASALFLLARHAESAEAWERARALSPPKPDLRPHLAAAYQAAGRGEEARRVLEELLRDDPAPQHVGALVRLLASRGDCGRARAVLSSPPAALAPALRAELEEAIDRCEASNSGGRDE